MNIQYEISVVTLIREIEKQNKIFKIPLTEKLNLYKFFFIIKSVKINHPFLFARMRSTIPTTRKLIPITKITLRFPSQVVFTDNEITIPNPPASVKIIPTTAKRIPNLFFISVIPFTIFLFS